MPAPAPRTIRMRLGKTLSFRVSEVHTYEKFESNVYARALAFLDLSLDLQKEQINDFYKFRRFVGMDHLFVKINKGLSEDERECLGAATDMIRTANTAMELVEYVKEQNPELGSKVEQLVDSALEKYHTLSEEGQQFVKEAYQYVTGEGKEDSPEVTADNRSNEEIYEQIHGMFMQLPEKVREEVLREMTWFIRPYLKQRYAEAMEKVKKRPLHRRPTQNLEPEHQS